MPRYSLKIILDKLELLKIHKIHNDVLLIKGIQLVAADGKFDKRLEQNTRPMCNECCYGIARKKLLRHMLNINQDILSNMKNLPGQTSQTDVMTSSNPMIMAQRIGFLALEKIFVLPFDQL